MSFLIKKAGIQDTFQDIGRFGFQHLGINPNGAFDVLALQIGNILLGNVDDEAALEIFFPSPEIVFQKSAKICISGADFGAKINGIEVLANSVLEVKQNDELTFSNPKQGNVAYICVKGGYKLDDWFGSESTNLPIKKGGFEGRKLLKNDIINLKNEFDCFETKVSKSYYHYFKNFNKKIRVLQSTEFNELNEISKKEIEKAIFKIGKFSNRMAITVEANLEKSTDSEMLSSPVQKGTVQLLPNGNFLILMADHQTTGGYPRILQIAKCDLPKLSQMKPDESFSFEIISLEEAENLLEKQEEELQLLRNFVEIKNL